MEKNLPFHFCFYSLFLLNIPLPFHNCHYSLMKKMNVWKQKWMLTFIIFAAKDGSHATQSTQEETDTVVTTNPTLIIITSATSAILLLAILVGVYIYFQKQKKKNTNKGMDIFPHYLPVVADLLCSNNIIYIYVLYILYLMITTSVQCWVTGRTG